MVYLICKQELVFIVYFLGKYEKDREVEEKESLVNCSDSSIFEGQELKRQHWDETLQSRYSVKKISNNNHALKNC